MARLVVNPGSPGAWEIALKPGTISLGRGFANDFKIEDPSVSGSHCQIVVDTGNVRIRDLGSTNGTFVNRTQVTEAALQPGHVIHLGSVEMLFQPDEEAPVIAAPQAATPPPAVRIAGAAPVVRIAAPAAPAVRVATPPVPAPAPAVRIATPPAPAARLTIAKQESAAVEEPPSAEPPPAPPMVPIIEGPVSHDRAFCKFHPKTPARFRCHKCNRFFCDMCVTTRGEKKLCRTCAVECVPVHVQLARPTGPKGFFARLPAAFAYPLRGSGVLMLIGGAIILGALNWFTGGTRFGFVPRVFGWWSLTAYVFGTGYFFAYLQSIIHATAVEDPELPQPPSMTDFWEDIVLPFLQLLVLVLFCFGPVLALEYVAIAYEQPAAGIAVMPALIIGCLYFPMAFLAVAMHDSVLSANPIVVVPSIIKVPLEYVVTLVLLAAVLVIRSMGDIVLTMLFPRGLSTHSMVTLVSYLGLQAFWGVASLYLLVVGMHILGLLYVTKKDRLGWLKR